MYHHKRVCTIITLRRIFEIVYVQNFICSPVIKQTIHLIFFNNLLFTYKMQFLLSKTALSALAATAEHKKFQDDVILTSALWSLFAKNLARRIFWAINIHLIVKRFELSWVKHLGIANSFLFLIFLCCFFHEMSQSTFPDQIRPRPLTACLNCAA